eukprot:TRINITY_DN1074_c0_g1_i1.p1 TRINITY_DN1074_c0_g1~~TRINITY_DN1074_c0_g1_i1.p1  ORF type:complete len:120 (+),score=60.66 TRINITY_DN1074_c0_g1_i1:58-417(+)
MVATWKEVKAAKETLPKEVNGCRRGLNKGFKVTKIAKTLNPAKRQALQKVKLAAVREVILETAGLSPYEKRITELLKVQREKRALRFAKRRLGSFQRGKKKREIVQNLMRQMASKKKAL